MHYAAMANMVGNVNGTWNLDAIYGMKEEK
jgi:hypothetical protein